MENIYSVSNLADNQVVVYTDKRIIFFSYGTRIATYNKLDSTLTLTSYWDYSRTTSKYLYQFVSLLPCYFNVCNKETTLKSIENGTVLLEDLVRCY